MTETKRYHQIMNTQAWSRDIYYWGKLRRKDCFISSLQYGRA